MNIVPINKCKISVPVINSKPQKWRGDKIFNVRYWVTLILGKRKSGKSTLIYTLLTNFVTKKMVVLFFVPTFYKDDTYAVMREWLDKKGVAYRGFTDVIEDGVNQIDEFMKVNHGMDETQEKEKEEIKCPFVKFNDPAPRKKLDKPLPPPEYFLIFDDISNLLKNKSVCLLIKNSRHYRAKIILSTQSVVDISPQIYGQTDYLCMMKNLNRDSLEKIYERIEPPLDSLEEFEQLYHTVTNNKHDFLLFSRENDEFGINLSKRIKL